MRAKSWTAKSEHLFRGRKVRATLATGKVLMYDELRLTFLLCISFAFRLEGRELRCYSWPLSRANFGALTREEFLNSIRTPRFYGVTYILQVCIARRYIDRRRRFSKDNFMTEEQFKYMQIGPLRNIGNSSGQFRNLVAPYSNGHLIVELEINKLRLRNNHGRSLARLRRHHRQV